MVIGMPTEHMLGFNHFSSLCWK